MAARSAINGIRRETLAANITASGQPLLDLFAIHPNRKRQLLLCEIE